jgi:glycosyltransferase involved in cell wall biosynthesis
VPALEQALAGLPPEAAKFFYRSSEVRDGHLLEMYRAASLFVYPSKAEGFGIPPLEAAALRIPVICSNTSAMKDFSFFGRNHVDPYDYEAFRRRIGEVLEETPDEDFLQRVSDIIRREYAWALSARKLYQLLLDGKKIVP